MNLMSQGQGHECFILANDADGDLKKDGIVIKFAEAELQFLSGVQWSL